LMDISQFLVSYPGRYVTQAFFHSLVASAIVEIAIKNFRIGSPSARQKALMAVIVFPIFSFPLYQLVNPARGSVYFRMGAIFDSSGWLNLEVLGVVPLGAGMILMFALTSLVFFFQELFPIARHAFATRKSDFGGAAVRKGDDPAIVEAVSSLSVEIPDIRVIEEEDCVIFSTTGKKAAIYVSSGLIGVLSVEQLRAALAHEIAHVVRSRRPFLVTVFVLRALMFFNPVVLLEFRRSVQEDEKICDEMAVSYTSKPLVLADTLKKLYLAPESGENGDAGPGSNAVGRMEDYSHRLNIESRISRLETGDGTGRGGEWLGLAIAMVAVVAVNYFVM
jgi:hypothetical protein